MNNVLLLTRNCLELTKACVKSLEGQDIPTRIVILDNGSTDGTIGWLSSPEYHHLWSGSHQNEGVSKGWNYGLKALFAEGAEHVLVANNDTIFPPYFYRALLACEIPFVTGASVDSIEALQNVGPFGHPYPGPDFSAFLIRRECYEKIGPFDESMINYCGDCDYHVRGHRLGMQLLNSGVPFYHERSSTLKKASEIDRAAICLQAERDRAAFKAKYGCMPWEPAYAELFLESTTKTE